MRPGDLYHARGQLELLQVPWTAVPGNHDIGDNPWPGAPEDIAVTGVRRQRWLDVVGTDCWSVDLADCGLLSMTFEPGKPPVPQFREPDGITQLTQNVDSPDLYRTR